ncbi:hypothetical protein SDRG_14939 [Saprolegnia diclina VS20]|nr:hypothetical protein SDRG_14939 [Saprolegnia diclina VS20]EQC27222.1 hypothetical protein SDRG_14939 [Saprolegnia diclina VS20]|eukprot:XP_008619321.1 hypothetical protein SDRG_14939 [Saprolegnia diclina VS20]
MAMLIFHDKLSALNVAGLFVATTGLVLYSYIKARPSSSSPAYALVHLDDVDIEDANEMHVK